jgi:hypothetical protein
VGLHRVGDAAIGIVGANIGEVVARARAQDRRDKGGGVDADPAALTVERPLANA